MSQDGHEGPTIISISAGSSHTVVACVSEGANLVVSAGRGEDGQLGHGSADGALSPKVISALTDAGVTAVVCGAEYSVAVSPARGEVFSWGW